GRGRELRQLGGRAPRTNDELTPAVGALAPERALGAGRAEGALEGADPRLRRIWQEIPVATFAVGAQLKHLSFLLGRRSETEARRAGLEPLVHGTGALDGHAVDQVFLRVATGLHAWRARPDGASPREEVFDQFLQRI